MEHWPRIPLTIRKLVVDKSKQYLALEGILILVVSDFLFVLGTSIWSPYLNIYFSSIGISGFNIGLISSLQGAASSLTMMPAGIIADRIGRKKPIIISFALTLLYISSLMVVRDHILILIMSMVQGVAIGLRTPTMSAYILDAVKERRGVAFATFHFFGIVGSILGTAIGAPVAETFGYATAFAFGAIVVLATGVIALFKLQESMARREKAERSTPMIQSFMEGANLMRDPRILLLVTGCVVHHVATNFAFSYLGLYFKYVLALDLVIVGVLMNARQVGDIVGQLPSGMLIDRVGAETVLFLHVFLTAPMVYFLAVSSNPYVLFLILLVWGSEAGWDMPSRRLLIVKYSKGMGSATALGAVQSFIGLMSLPSPAIGGWIWDNLGASPLFQISALVNAIACVPLAMLMRNRRRKTQKE